MRFFFMLFLLLLSLTVQANPGWTDYGHVIELVPTIQHRYKVNIEVDGNKSGCKEKQWFYQDYDLSGAREMYLALLEAVSSNKKVRVYVSGNCNIENYAEISAIGIRR